MIDPRNLTQRWNMLMTMTGSSTGIKEFAVVPMPDPPPQGGPPNDKFWMSVTLDDLGQLAVAISPQPFEMNPPG